MQERIDDKVMGTKRSLLMMKSSKGILSPE
jgi:hypothetical protein